MNLIQYAVVVCSSIMLSACGSEPNIGAPPPASGPEYQSNMIYPKPDFGWVGDPMPFYEDGKINMFYLHDGRDGQIGFHSYHLMTSEDFYTWNFKGMVIPFDNDETSQDLALGTGSVIKDETGLYHAFYTGFNDRGFVAKHEKIQHATSVDKVNWIKHPEDGFYGRDNDFRDPFVIYIKEFGEYWMLITSKDLQGNAAILRYTSTDLVNWTNQGVFFSDPEQNWNLECPSLVNFNGYWYLSYSRQTGETNKRTLLYYYTDDLKPANTAWTKASLPYFDGPGQYAGRIEHFGDKLFVSGWVGTKADANANYDWAGNLVTHELVQHPDGTLTPEILTSLQEKLNVVNGVTTTDSSAGVYVNASDKMEFSADGYQYIGIEPLFNQATRTTLKVALTGGRDHFGFIFNTSYDQANQLVGDTKLEINLNEDQIKLFTSNTSQPYLHSHLATHHLGNEVTLELLTEGDIVSLYVDNTVAFTARIKNASKGWGVFSYNTDLRIDELSHFVAD